MNSFVKGMGDFNLFPLLKSRKTGLEIALDNVLTAFTETGINILNTVKTEIRKQPIQKENLMSYNKSERSNFFKRKMLRNSLPDIKWDEAIFVGLSESQIKYIRDMLRKSSTNYRYNKSSTNHTIFGRSFARDVSSEYRAEIIALLSRNIRVAIIERLKQSKYKQRSASKN